MSIFQSTRGKPLIAVAICDRCRLRRPYVQLAPDRNLPGLMVCNLGCNDQRDPYRLPARKTERIDLRRPRPDVPVTDGVRAGYITTQDGFRLSDESGNLILD